MKHDGLLDIVAVGLDAIEPSSQPVVVKLFGPDMAKFQDACLLRSILDMDQRAGIV